MDLGFHAENILKNVFEVDKNEKVLVLSEKYSENAVDLSEKDKKRWRELNNITRLLFDEMKQIHPGTWFFEYDTTFGHGREPGKEAWEMVFGEEFVNFLFENDFFDKLKEKRLSDDEKGELVRFVLKNKANFDVIVAITNFSTSHTFFRKLFTEVAGGRYASMPMFDPKMFETSMLADISELADFTTKLANYLNKFAGFKIESDNGTNLYISKKDREVLPDTGKLNKPGSFGNLPAGEAFVAPVEGESYGVLVIEYAPTRKLESPIKIYIENGEVVNIEGDESYVDELKQKLSAHPNNKIVAELGIGTNKHAKILDNILESEKIYGTVHIAFGDNYAFGGKNQAPFHEDYLVLSPVLSGVKEDGTKEIIMQNKRYEIKI